MADTKVVTQLSPDLDACLAVWLLRRFGGYEKAELAFISTGTRLKDDGTQRIVYVDTSGGPYDHHETDEMVCAASLVFHDLKLEADEALATLVRFAILVDHGLIMDTNVGDFNLIHVIYGLNRILPDDPSTVIEVSGRVFDALYAYLKDKLAADRELRHAYHFQTKWGPGIGVTTANRQVRYLAHHQGFKVFVYVDPKSEFRGFQSPGGSGVDFTQLYEHITRIEPDADWFLHASKELLLCGSAKAPQKRLSRLSLETLVSLVSLQGHLYAETPNI